MTDEMFEKGLQIRREVLGALTLYRAAVFDWLLDKFPAGPRA
jgi:hypothetical protein